MLTGRRTHSTGIALPILWLSVAAVLSLPAAIASAQTPPAPGGFVELATSTQVRPPLTPAQIQSLLPTRGAFTFPPPYSTRGIRLTNSSDCVGSDCVWYVGYSYWRNMNNHVGSDVMYVFLGLDRNRGGGGPTLFSYNKVTEAVTKVGPLFDPTDALSWASGEGWYFSATRPTTIYLNSGPALKRFDVLSKLFETVLDVSTQTAIFGANRTIWQMHSSNDDRVHSATLKDATTSADLGCFAYREDTQQYFYFPQRGFAYDECQIDKTGQWLVIKEKLGTDPASEVDNRIINLSTGVETDLMDRDGAGGHSDNGYGYMIAADNWNALPNALRLWKFGPSPLVPGAVVYYDPQWIPGSVNHVSHANTTADLVPEAQYACGSAANATNGPRANEIVCFALDGSLRTLVVAPVMTDMNAPGGVDSYGKLPKGNLDVTGQYFIWTSNMGGNRQDAFIVRVPSQVLTAGTPRITVTPRTVAIGGTVTATIANPAGNVSDWVALYDATATPPNYLDWMYLNGAKTAPASGLTAATVTFTLPTTPGSYNVRLLSNGSFNVTATSVTVTNPTITVTPTAVLPGGTVTATIANGVGDAADWVGLYDVSAVPTNYLDWQYLNGLKTRPAAATTAATITFTMPTAPGTYNLRFLSNGSYNVLATSITVNVGTPSVTVTPTAVLPGGVVTATVANGPGNPSDWVALYDVSAGPTSYIDWQYLNGTKTRPATGMIGAALTFTLPSTPGSYNVRLMSSGSYNVLATSVAVNVGTPAVSINPTTVLPGGVVTATVSNGPGNASDWVALYDASAAPTNYLDWKYLNGTTTRPATGMTGGTITFTMPTMTGTYNVRLLSNGSFNVAATSAPIIVATNPTIVAAPTAIGPGGTVTATVASGGGHVSDWVALYDAGAALTNYLDWKYLNGLKTPPAIGMTGATVPFTMPTTSGTYILRFMLNGSYTVLAASALVTVGADTTPPVISSVAASSITASGATITWTTNEGSDTQVDYGLTTAYGSTSTLNASLVMSHSVGLSGLTGATLYHYRVRSRDAAGNLALSTDQTFTTLDGTAPTVSITAPAASATVAGPVTVSASASDDVGVVGVQFKLDGAPLGAEDTTAPYSVTWDTTTTTNGAHLLTAVARDAAGNTTTSAAVSVTVGNDTTPPVISNVVVTNITGSGATVTWTTDEASDTQVDYGLTTSYGSSTPLNTSLVTSHSVALTGMNQATHYNCRVKSKDAAGNVATSTNCSFTTLDTTPPSVSITAPATGATVSGVVPVTANASDNVGVVGVQFKLDGAVLGVEDTTSPYSVSWTSTTATNGSHTLTAVARDAAGNSTTSAGITVTVNNDITPPVISAVTATAITPAGATITWTTDEGSDSQVDYGLTSAYGSSTTLNASLVTSHSVAVGGLAPSTVYHYRVRSRDAAGNLATSGDFTFTTAPDSLPPTVSITAPANGATVSGTTLVTANASDNVGVVGLQFKLDGAPLGVEDTASPYSVSWRTQGTPDLIFGVVKVSVGGMTINAGTGFTKRLAVSCPSCTGDDTASEDSVQTAAGAAAATFTFSTGAHYHAHMAAFKALAPPAYIQGIAATTNTGAATMAQTFAAPTVAGNLIVVAVAWRGSSSLSVTDSQGNTYAVATTAYDSIVDQSLGILYAANVTGGADTVTASFGSPVPTVQRLEIHEYSGVATVNPLDTTSTNITNGSTVVDNVTSGSATTTVIPPFSSGSHALTAVARDAAGNTATSAVVTVTVNNDFTPPVISAVAASSITATGATITWTTDEGSDSQVDYGLTTAYGSTSTLDASLVTSHSVALSGLTGPTVYHYRVRSRDAGGNLALSSDFTFTTLDVTPPVISAVSAFANSGVDATIFWTTNEGSDSQVDYGLTSAYGSSTTLDPSLVTSHTVAVTGLTSLTTYHYRVRSRDASGNLALSTDRTFTTLDGVAPSVSVTAPAGGAIVSGTVTVTANASDNVGVVGVQFQLDGAPLGSEDSVAPYSVAWDTTTASAGTHTLTAVARDAAGNTTTSSAVIVTVSNALPPITLVWDANTEPNLSGYKVYVGTTSGVYSAPINVGNVTSFIVPNLTPGTLYFFAVTAFDTSANESGKSNEVSAVR